VVSRYTELGARRCEPVYNALDPLTHHPVAPNPRFAADLGFLANRLPDRERRVEEFFLRAAEALPDKQLMLGGNGWHDKAMPANVRAIGHVGTADHNAFNCTPRAVLNVARDSMADIGFSPATRVFEAAGAAACLITDAWEGIELFLQPETEVLVARDSMAAVGFSPATRVFEAAGAGACLITDAWEGIELFLTPDEEVLVARDGADVAEIVAALTPERAREIGRAALERIAAEHTYTRRGAEVDALFRRTLAGERERSLA
jgi:spore maturation protein CgeB